MKKTLENKVKQRTWLLNERSKLLTMRKEAEKGSVTINGIRFSYLFSAFFFSSRECSKNSFNSILLRKTNPLVARIKALG